MKAAVILLLLGIIAISAAQSGRRYPYYGIEILQTFVLELGTRWYLWCLFQLILGGSKPGSCYRPQRYRREVLVEPEVEEQDHEIVKRQVQGGNGIRPGYPNPGWGWKPTAPVRTTTTTRRPRCYSDYDCIGKLLKHFKLKLLRFIGFNFFTNRKPKMLQWKLSDTCFYWINDFLLLE